MKTRPKEHETIYTQDCEFYRHNDNLKWSRFQTLSVIEGAVLFALYEYKEHLTLNEQRGLMLFGFLLVGILCLLALKDQFDEQMHLNRLKAYEHDLDNPFEKNHTCLPLGSTLMNIGIWSILLFNAIILCMRWSSECSPLGK